METDKAHRQALYLCTRVYAIPYTLARISISIFMLQKAECPAREREISLTTPPATRAWDLGGHHIDDRVDLWVVDMGATQSRREERGGSMEGTAPMVMSWGRACAAGESAAESEPAAAQRCSQKARPTRTATARVNTTVESIHLARALLPHPSKTVFPHPSCTICLYMC